VVEFQVVLLWEVYEVSSAKQNFVTSSEVAAGLRNRT